MKLSLVTLMIYLAALSMAQAQTTDEQAAQSMASERQRLANQRIQADAEIKAREEQRRLEEAEQERLRAEQEAMKSEEAIAPRLEYAPTAAKSSVDLSRTLEQLRSLGELKDDGYITEEEFQRIKQKILDSKF